MSVLPANTSGLPPVEALFYAGYSKNNYANSRTADLLGAGATFTGPWEDVSGYCEFRLLTLSNVASAAGGVHIDWSMDGITQHATEAAGTALAATLYDSGVIAYHMPFIRVRYTNGAATQVGGSFLLRLLFSPTAVGGGGGGGPAANVNIISPIGLGDPSSGVRTDVATYQESQPSPNPSAVLGVSPLPLLTEPDGALRTRARVLTDEGAFSDDFARPGATVYRALTGLWTIAAGGLVATGAAGAALTEFRKGDYFQLDADNSLTAPKWVQVASITNNNTINFVTAYTGTIGGAAAAASWSPWGILVSDAGGAVGVANSIVGLAPGLANGSMVMLYRALSTVGTFKMGMPFRLRFRADMDNRRANQHIAIQVTDSAGIQIAKVEFEGTDNTVVALRTGGSNATTSQLAVNGTVPGPLNTTASMHTYEALFLQHMAVLTCDGQVMATCPYHLPDPYFWSYTATSFMMLTVSVQNAAALAGATVLAVDEVGVENLDTVQVEAYSLDASKFNATIGSITTAGLVESKPAPDPSAISGSAGGLLLEPDRALRTRARVLTDEGSFADDFSSNVMTPLTGLCTFGASATVTGVGTLFTTELKVGDYVEVGADHDPLNPKLMQVKSIESDLALTLVAPYTGAGGVGVVGAMTKWYVHYVAADAGSITRPGGTSYFRLNAGTGNNDDASLKRWLFMGVPAKGTLPLEMTFLARLGSRVVNQNANLAVYFLTPGFSSQGMARFRFDGGEADGLVWCEARPTNDVPSTASLQVALPASGLAVNWHLYRFRVDVDRVDFWIDDGAGNWSLVYSAPYHAPYPYDRANIELLIGNTAVIAGSANFDIDWVAFNNFDSVRAKVECMDPTKLLGSVRDITPRALATGQGYTFVADVSVQVATVVIGRRYRICVEGGAGCCITTVGAAASRITDQSYYDHDNWDEFVATQTAIYGITLIAGAAKSTVKMIPVN